MPQCAITMSQARRYILSSIAALATLGLVGCPAGSSQAREPTGQASGHIAGEVAGALPEVVKLYRWFHAHPELSEKEVKTAARLAKELRAIGLEVHAGIGGHGLVGILRSAGAPPGPGDPVVLYRADMDALPITEQTGLPYASKNPGVMHACGHDIHMATAVGTLRILKAMDTAWRGTVLFIGQPAEEIGRGARAMLADPKLQSILSRVGKPRVAFALHDSHLAAGKVAIAPGYMFANVDSIDIVVHGKGGHGARPHQTVDPIVIGSEIVVALQTIVSRRLPPGTKAVITVGKFGAGTKHNIIPPQATLLLTVRSYSNEVRETLLREIESVAKNVSKAHNATRMPSITVHDSHTPAGYNDPAWVARLESLFERTLGPNSVTRQEATMGGEDFGFYARMLKIPGVMWRLGAGDPEAYRTSNGVGLPGLHSDKWAPSAEPTLRTGMLTMTAAILEALRK